MQTAFFDHFRCMKFDFKFVTMESAAPVDAGVNVIVNRDLFGFAIRWFRDFDLQQAVFVGCLDILGIHIQGQEEIQDSLTSMLKPVYR